MRPRPSAGEPDAHGKAEQCLPHLCWTPAPQREGGRARGARAGSWAGGVLWGTVPHTPPQLSEALRAIPGQGLLSTLHDHRPLHPWPCCWCWPLSPVPRIRFLAQHLQCPKNIILKVSWRREGVGRTEAPWECRGLGAGGALQGISCLWSQTCAHSWPIMVRDAVQPGGHGGPRPSCPERTRIVQRSMSEPLSALTHLEASEAWSLA